MCMIGVLDAQKLYMVVVGCAIVLITIMDGVFDLGGQLWPTTKKSFLSLFFFIFLLIFLVSPCMFLSHPV